MSQNIANIDLSQEELVRYARHLALEEFNITEQKQLKASKVLIIGAGGLGVPVLQYLTAAGIGTIGIIDGDKIELSNLQRQILYSIHDIGKFKVNVAQERLSLLNSNVDIKTYPYHLNIQNAKDIIKEYDVIVDGTDNIPTRYIINDTCVDLNKPIIYGAINQYTGQVSVLNHPNNSKHRSPNYRDLFPYYSQDTIPNCAESGIIGALAGIIGSIQANETIKLITDISPSLIGKLLLLDAKDYQVKILKIPSNQNNQVVPKISDYAPISCSSSIKSITPKELDLLIKEHEPIQIIDVREGHEYQSNNINGTLLPANSILKNIEKIDRDKKVIIHCQSGKRSLKVIQLLQELHGFTNLYNLQGGITTWTQQIKKPPTVV